MVPKHIWSERGSFKKYFISITHQYNKAVGRIYKFSLKLYLLLPFFLGHIEIYAHFQLLTQIVIFKASTYISEVKGKWGWTFSD